MYNQCVVSIVYKKNIPNKSFYLNFLIHTYLYVLITITCKKRLTFFRNFFFLLISVADNSVSSISFLHFSPKHQKSLHWKFRYVKFEYPAKFLTKMRKISSLTVTRIRVRFVISCTRCDVMTRVELECTIWEELVCNRFY